VGIGAVGEIQQPEALVRMSYEPGFEEVGVGVGGRGFVERFVELGPGVLT
jgi:hypothetical protein